MAQLAAGGGGWWERRRTPPEFCRANRTKANVNERERMALRWFPARRRLGTHLHLQIVIAELTVGWAVRAASLPHPGAEGGQAGTESPWEPGQLEGSGLGALGEGCAHRRTHVCTHVCTHICTQAHTHVGGDGAAAVHLLALSRRQHLPRPLAPICSAASKGPSPCPAPEGPGRTSWETAGRDRNAPGGSGLGGGGR